MENCIIIFSEAQMLNANLYHALAVHRGHCLIEYPPQLLEIQSSESSFNTGRHLVHEMSRQRPIYFEMLGRDTKMFQEIKNYRTPSLHLRVEFQSFSGFKAAAVRAKSCCCVAKSCLTLCSPMNCSLPGSPAHGILQARILEWVAISSSRGSSRTRN